MARETGWVAVWDETHWLYLLSRTGQRQAQRHFNHPLNAACASDDGSAIVAASKHGDVWWLAPDLTIRWERTLAQPILACALDSFGQYLALSDAGGSVQLFDRAGQPVAQVNVPRPLHHLAFATTRAQLFGCADFGLVACFDLSGKWLWRDGLVAHVGAISVSGDGESFILSCYSEGLCRYGASGKKLEPLTPIESCRWVAQSFDGELVLAGSQRLFLLDRTGRTLGTHLLDKPLAALAFAALGDYAVTAYPDGSLVAWDVGE